MGVFGTLRNAGKIAGPAVVGGLLELWSFALVFGGLAAVLTAVARSLLLRGRFIDALVRSPISYTFTKLFLDAHRRLT